MHALQKHATWLYSVNSKLKGYPDDEALFTPKRKMDMIEMNTMTGQAVRLWCSITSIYLSSRPLGTRELGWDNRRSIHHNSSYRYRFQSHNTRNQRHYLHSLSSWLFLPKCWDLGLVSIPEVRYHSWTSVDKMLEWMRIPQTHTSQPWDSHHRLD